MLAFAWQVMQVTVFFLWKPSLFLFSLSGLLLGWWYCPCVCCGSQRCYRLSFNWCKWSLWGIRTVSCARNIRLSPGSQGLYISFYCCSRNDPMIMFYISQVCLADAGSEATWKGSSNWCIIDCCWRGKLRYLFQMQSKVSLISHDWFEPFFFFPPLEKTTNANADESWWMFCDFLMHTKDCLGWSYLHQFLGWSNKLLISAV